MGALMFAILVLLSLKYPLVDVFVYITGGEWHELLAHSKDLQRPQRGMSEYTLKLGGKVQMQKQSHINSDYDRYSIVDLFMLH